MFLTQEQKERDQAGREFLVQYYVVHPEEFEVLKKMVEEEREKHRRELRPIFQRNLC